jgi:hypothetical protein
MSGSGDVGQTVEFLCITWRLFRSDYVWPGPFHNTDIFLFHNTDIF